MTRSPFLERLDLGALQHGVGMAECIGKRGVREIVGRWSFGKTPMQAFLDAAAALAARHHPCLPHALAVWTRIAASLGGDAHGQRNRAHGYGRILALDADHSALTVGIAVGYSGERRLAD